MHESRKPLLRGWLAFGALVLLGAGLVGVGRWVWLGESWRSLFASGVEQVSLLEDGRVVYGPMSLRPLE